MDLISQGSGMKAAVYLYEMLQWRAEGLTGMYLTLEVDLVSVWVSASRDVDCRHVEAVVSLTNTLHIADQVRVLFCLAFVPHHYGTIVMLGRENVWKLDCS